MLYCYTGEVDQDGKICGYGSAFSQDFPENTFEGTHFNDKPHGICKSFCRNLAALLTSVFTGIERHPGIKTTTE